MTPDLESAKRFFHVLGISSMITSYEVSDKDFALLKKIPVNDKYAFLYKYVPFKGRFLLFNRAVYVEDTNAAIEKLTDNAIDLRSTLILIGKDKKQNGGEGGLVGTATLVSYDANKMIIECEAKTDTFLYVSDTFYPGWRAYVDGTKTEIYRANLAFRAIKIPKGSHRVVFRYVPLSFYAGLFLTISGIALSVWLIRRERKNGGANV
jgi:hypothetical protein